MTICPECGTGFETSDAIEDDVGVLQALAQHCPSCGYETDVAIVNYPNQTYTVLAEALAGDSCDHPVPRGDDRYGFYECGAPAAIRTQSVGRPVKGWCEEHVGEHFGSAMAFRDEL